MPVLQAVELAFSTASLSTGGRLAVDLVPLDIARATGTDVARDVASDPSFVAAIAAPDVRDQASIVRELASAGVPTLSLSAGHAAVEAPAGTWLRLVAPLRVQARALAGAALSARGSGRGVCLVASAPDGSDYARALERSLAPRVDVLDLGGAGGVAEAGCRVVVWAGGAEGGAALAAALRDLPGRRRILLGGPGLREPAFLELAGRAADGTVSLCSCADVGTSLDLAAQRFVQDYQSQYGSPPGPFAVEGWDGARALVKGLLEGGSTRGDLVTWLSGVTKLDGLGGPYVLSGGELADPASAVRRYRVEGGRWVAVGDR